MTTTLPLIIAFALEAAGFLGAFVPVIPGPPLSYAGLILLKLSGNADFSPAFLWLWAAITAAVTIADNILPALMTRRFGGSRAAVIGSVVGLIAGILFFPPAGFIVGPFLGAFIGELINNRCDGLKAFTVAIGAFLAFMVGTGAKMIASGIMLFYAVKAVLF